MESAATTRMTWEEYLAFEETSEGKHEYHGGVLVAMVGVTRAHARLAGRLYAALLAHLDGKRCVPFVSDFRIRVEAADCGLYPDVFASCVEGGAPGDLYSTEAALVIEVLSKSTEAYDRGDKFALYKQLPSLRGYVLVDTKAVSVDVFRRGDGGVWLWPARLGPGDTLTFDSVDLPLSVDALYAGLGIAEGR